ncbi:MAG: ankyrin repeat domain-containing protein [Xanthomonadaceae bacterium]|nr:ankyrin repeat domain-containing protein [Xanthomonadaceae bacterium]
MMSSERVKHIEEHLVEAARVGDHERVECLLRLGAHPDGSWRLKDGTPLIVAGRAGHRETVRVLLAYGANPNTCDHLLMSLRDGYLDITRLLLEAGCVVDPRTIDHAVNHGDAKTCSLLLGHLAPYRRGRLQLQSRLNDLTNRK